jgi:hypothetical protein
VPALVLLLLASQPPGELLRTFVKEGEALALEAELRKTAAALHSKLKRVDACELEDVSSQLSRLVAENLQQKHDQHFPLDAARIRRQVIGAEAFKLETFIATGGYVYELSERTKAKRWALPVLLPKGGLKLILSGVDYPEQLTSWSTVYHVLQRYGGYVALSRFTDAFDAHGALLERRKE